MSVSFQSGFEELIISVTDYVFEKVFLLHFYEAHFEFLFSDKLQILVDGLKPQVDGLRFVVFHKIAFISEKILACHILVFFKEMCYRPHIRTDSIRRQILARKE